MENKSDGLPEGFRFLSSTKAEKAVLGEVIEILNKCADSHNLCTGCLYQRECRNAYDMHSGNAEL